MSTIFCCTICIWILLQLTLLYPYNIDCETEPLHVILNQSECKNKFYLQLNKENKNSNYCSTTDRNKAFLGDSVTVTYMNYENLERKISYPEIYKDCNRNCEDLEYRNNNSKLINRNSLKIHKDLAYRDQTFITKLTLINYVNCCIWQHQSSNQIFFKQNEGSNTQGLYCSILTFKDQIFLIKVRNPKNYEKSLSVCQHAKEIFVFIKDNRKVKRRESIKPIDQKQRRLTKPQKKKSETSSILAATIQGRSDKRTSIHGFSSMSRDLMVFYEITDVTVSIRKVQMTVIKLNRMTTSFAQQVFTGFTREIWIGDRHIKLIYLGDSFRAPEKELAVAKNSHIRNYKNNYIYKCFCTLSSFTKNNRYFEKQSQIDKLKETSLLENKHTISDAFSKSQNIGKPKGKRYLCSIADSNNSDVDIKRIKTRLLLSTNDKFEARHNRDVDRHYINRKRRLKNRVNIKLHRDNYNKDKVSKDFLEKNAEIQDFTRATATKNCVVPSSYSAEKEKSGTLASNSMKNPSDLSLSADTGEDYQQQIDHQIAKDFGEITDILRAEKIIASPPRKVANCRGAANVASSARPLQWSSSGAKNNRQSVSREFQAGPPFPPRMLRPRNLQGTIDQIDTREPEIITISRDSRQRQQVIRPAFIRKSVDSKEFGANAQRLVVPRAKLDFAMGELESATRDEATRNITAAATQPGDTKKLVAEALIISRLADGSAKPLSLLLLAPMSNDSAVEHYSYESETLKLNELFGEDKNVAKMGISNDISKSKCRKLKEESSSRNNFGRNENIRKQESIDEGIELENELKQLKRIFSHNSKKIRFVDRNKSKNLYSSNSASTNANNMRISKDDAESINKDESVKNDGSSPKLVDKMEVILKNSEIAFKNKKLLPVSNHSKLQVLTNNRDNKLVIYGNVRSKNFKDDRLGQDRINNNLSGFKNVTKNSLFMNSLLNENKLSLGNFKNKISAVVKTSKRKCRSKVNKLSSYKKVAKKKSKVSQQKRLPLIDNHLLCKRQYIDNKNFNKNNKQNIRQTIATGQKNSLSETDKAYYDDYYNYENIETPVDYIDENKSVKESPLRRKLLSLKSFEYDEESFTIGDGESNYDYEEKFYGDSRYEKAESQLHHPSIELRNAALSEIAKVPKTDLKIGSASRNFNKSFDLTYNETTYSKMYEKIKPSNKDLEVRFLKRSLKSVRSKKKKHRQPKKKELYVSGDLVGYNYQPELEKSNVRRERKDDDDGEKRLRPMLEPGQEFEISVKGKLKMHLDDSNSDKSSDSSERRKRFSAPRKIKSRKIESERKFENSHIYPVESYMRHNREGNSTIKTASLKSKNPLQKIGDFFKKKFAGTEKLKRPVCRKKIHANVKITPVKTLPWSDHHSDGEEKPACEDNQSTLDLPESDLQTTTSNIEDFTPTQTSMPSSSSPYCKCEIPVSVGETNIVFTSTAMNTIQTDQKMMTTNGLAPDTVSMTTDGLASDTASMTTDGLAPEGVTMTDNLAPEETTIPPTDVVSQGTTILIDTAGSEGTTMDTSHSINNKSSNANLQGMLDILNFIKKLEKFIDERGPLKIRDENGSIEIKLQKIFIQPGKKQSIPVLEDGSNLQSTNDLSFKVVDPDLIHQVNNVDSISPQKKKSENTVTELEARPESENENLDGIAKGGNSNSASNEESNVVSNKHKAQDYEAMKGYIENPIPKALLPTKNRLDTGDFATVAKQRLDEQRIGVASGVDDHPSSSSLREKKSHREKRKRNRKTKNKKKRRKGNRTRIGGKKARQLQRRQNDFAFARASRASEKRRRDKSSARQQRHRVRGKKRRRMLTPAAADWLY